MTMIRGSTRTVACTRFCFLVAGIFGLTVLTGVTGLPGVAAAQCDIGAEVERAGMMIERAGELVERSGLPEARELLRAAITRRSEAVERAKRGETEYACRLARVSQNLAEKSAEVARRGLRSLEELEQMLQKTNEILRETGNLISDNRGSDEASRFLAAAGERQKEAWGAFRSRRPRLAIKLTLMAREAAERARRLVEGGGADDPRIVERELHRTDRLLQEAIRVLGQDGEADGEGKVAAARRMQRQAERQLGLGRHELALGLTHQARRMIRSALGEKDMASSPRDVETLIQTTAELVERLGPEVAESGNRRARDLLSRASDLLRDARSALEADRLRRALGAARSASALALDVSEMLERGGE